MTKQLETVDIPDVEILAIGTWQGSTGPAKFSAKDLENIVSAFDTLTLDGGLNYAPPIKLGHDENQKLLQKDGYPAAGWIDSLKVEGEKIVANFKKVPKKIGDLIKAGAYKKVSCELYENYKIGGKTYPMVLKAAALLGADIPAVKSIADIQALYTEGDQPFKVVVFEESAGATQVQMVCQPVADESAEPDRIAASKQAGVGNFEEVERQMEKLLREVLGLDEKADVIAAVKELKAKSQEATQLSEQTKGQKEAAETEAKALKVQLAERDAAEAVNTAIAAGKLAPVQKDKATAWAKTDLAGFKSFMETQPKVVDLGTQGGGEGEGDAVQLTETELKLAEQMGVTRDMLMAQKKAEKAKQGGK